MTGTMKAKPIKRETYTLTIAAGTDYCYISKRDGYALLNVVPTTYVGNMIISVCEDVSTWDVFWKNVFSSTQATTITCHAYWYKTD